MSFKDGRIGVGKDPIFPLDISGSCRIDGDLILGGRFSDSQGNPIQLGSGSGATSTPDQTSSSLPSWQGGTITTQGLGIFKGRFDSSKYLTLITGDTGWNTSTTGTHNTSCGQQSGHSITSGAYNSSLGSRAGVNITTGSSNTCMGYDSGKMLTTGSNNTFIGSNSGEGAWPTTGSDNTCVGMQSGLSITSGSWNTFLGRMAGNNVTNCHSSVVIGYKAMSQYNLSCCTFVGYKAGKDAMQDNHVGLGYSALVNKKANVCTAIGYQCMGGDSPNSDHVGYNTGVGCNVLRVVQGSSTNQGCYNTVMGHHAAYNLTTGYKNVIIGSHAANNNTHLNQSVAIGHYAGYNITSSSANVLIGIKAGMTITSGSQNTLLGYQAGHNITTGTYNCAMGYNSMWNGAGHFNVALGDQTLASGANTQKNNNIAIGYQALYMTTHDNLVAVGHQAGMNNSSGGANTYVGFQAGKSTTTSSNNTFVGYEAGMNNTSSQNTFVGKGCGKATTSGFDNTAMGHYSMYANTSGYGNNAMGYYSLSQNTTGDYNVAIGVNAAAYNSSGNYNVAIGLNANQYVQTRHYNIAIGAYAMAGNSTSATSADHQLYINSHNGFFGQSSFIYGHMKMDDNPYLVLNAKMGIGTADPKGLLHIYGTTHSSYSYSGLLRLVSSSSNGGGSGNWAMINFPDSNTASSANENYYMIGRGHQYSDNCLTLHVPTDGSIDMTSTGAVRMMKIQGNGKVGIGTTSPKFPLDVDDSNTSTDMTYWNRSTGSSTRADDGAYFSTANDGTRSGSNYGQSEIGDLDSGTTYPSASIGNFNIAAHFKNGVYISDGALYVSSDRRIKTNIVDVKDNLALEMVRNIPCRYYNYNDKLSRGTNATIGFIAQEVKEIYPRAVVERTQFIPNEMRNLNDLRWNDTTLFTDLSDCSGITYRFYVGNDPSGNDEIRKDIIGNSDNSFTFDTSYNNVFCYGKEVDDFHTLDKAKLFALNFSATQELDRKVTALETVGNQDQNVKILDLYKENQELKARLAKIEAFLGI